MTEKCIGECIEPNKKTLHPITLDIILNDKTASNICPIDPHLNNMNNNAEEKMCNNDNLLNIEEVKEMILTPKIKFNIKSFLNLYNITSFDAGILWIKINIKVKEFRTINRILNSLWIAFNDKIKKINSDLIEIYLILNDKLNIHYNLNTNKKINDKIIKKSLKRFLDETTDWSDYNFNPNLEISKSIIKYSIKYSKK